MQPKSIYRLTAVWVIGLLASCIHVEPTPPGAVAPPAPPQVVKPYRAAAEQMTEVQPQAMQPSDTGHPSSPAVYNRQTPPSSGSLVMDQFKQQYRRKGSPRVAVYLNRALSDDVREWNTQRRLVVAIEGEITSETEKRTDTFKGPGGVSVYQQTHNADQERRSPGESWMWSFEEGFLNPFLKTGTRIVDRATIMRLAASESGQQGSAYAPIAVKAIEMDALKGKADIFIEILIRRAPKTELGYEFRASAKEVQTGIVRAIVTSNGWNYNRPAKEKVIATETGYRFVDEKDTADLPEVQVVAKDLALAMMGDLVNNWQQ
jgi:hypothetical protein